MHKRLVAMEEGKDPALHIRTNQSRVLPIRLLRYFLLFLVLVIGFTIFSTSMSRYFSFESSQSCLHVLDKGGPLPVAPLWERFFKEHEENYSIYIHTLPMYNENYPPSSAFYRRQIPSQVPTITILSHLVTSLNICYMIEVQQRRSRMGEDEHVLRDDCSLMHCFDISNEWFILLSEACIPLQSFPIVYHYIASSQYSFMGSYDDPGPFGRGRYDENMAPLVNLTDWHKGSQWFEINRKLAVDIVEDVTFYTKFEQYCRPACYVDEHYFQTMLSIRPPHLLANRSLTWVDWSRGGAHPGTFGKADMTHDFFKNIIEGQTCIYNKQLSSSCFLFARKFAPSALETLVEHSSQYFG